MTNVCFEFFGIDSYEMIYKMRLEILVRANHDCHRL